jgi:rhodanese-related sulfurtransferase
MRKILPVLLALGLLVALLGCSTQTATLDGDEEITMENIDDYLVYDARFVDLRNFEDMFNGGYIAGFEVVPFFQYLEGRALVRNNGWEFSGADIVDEVTLENIFGADKEAAIVLMCGSGTRAGYVKEALENMGYTKVFNAGGIRDYAGANKIFGDGEYTGLSVLPATIDMTNIDSFLGRKGAKYVDLRNVADKYVGGYIDGFEVVSFFEYFEGRAFNRDDWEFSTDEITDEIVIQNYFGTDLDREIFLMCGSGTRAGYFKDVLEAIGYTTVYNVGGIRDYAGEHKIFGDEGFSL